MQIEDNTLSASDLALIADDNSGDDSSAPAADTGKPAGDAPAATDKGAEGSKPAADGKPAGDAGKPAADAGKWFTDDWKEKAIAGVPESQRKKAEAYIARRSSPYDILNGAMSADDKIAELTRDRIKIPTGKDDDPKDVAAFRKAMGIPDSPDKYEVKVPKEYGELSELDTELKDAFLERALSTGMSQKQVDLAMDNYFAIEKVKAAEQAKLVLASSTAAQDELRVHFGKEYRQSVELTNRFFAEGLGKNGMAEAEDRREFLSKRFADGTALGEHPAFVKFMAELARERADDGAFIMGEGTDGVDIDAKIDKIIKTRNSDPKAYAAMQPELERLVAAQNRMKARKG
jgi:hypothetical protein